ncbi:MAG TPA: efflux RND transporter periplasmic adaptor subunit [Candidatus Binataceae bacterium]|nr:efflux RND transporter periplasmic adaptor subunit [Candidatus Binataceae bacterium]
MRVAAFASLALCGYLAQGDANPAAAAGLSARDGQFDCLIEPFRTVEVRSPVVGVINKLFVSRGSMVRQGEPLVRLDSTVESAAVDLALFKAQMTGPLQAAESRLLYAQTKARRKSDLAASHYVSTQDRDDAEAEAAVAHADVQTARETQQLSKLEYSYAVAQLGLRLIRSPINGVVVDQAMDVGDLAQPGQSTAFIFKLAEIDLLRVKAIVPLAYYPRIKLGQRADVVPEQPIGGHYTATLTVVDKVIDAASGTFEIRMDLRNPKGALPAGLKCTVRLW